MVEFNSLGQVKGRAYTTESRVEFGRKALMSIEIIELKICYEHSS